MKFVYELQELRTSDYAKDSTSDEILVDVWHDCPHCGSCLACLECGEHDYEHWRPGQLIGLREYENERKRQSD